MKGNSFHFPRALKWANPQTRFHFYYPVCMMIDITYFFRDFKINADEGIYLF